MNINYDKLAEFAASRSISYDDLCAVVRDSLIAQASTAPEQDAVGQWSDDEGLTWCDGSEQELASARAAGWVTRKLYLAPNETPEQRPVAEIRYTGYEPTNRLNWLGKNDLQLFKDGTKLYTHPSAEIERLRAEHDSFQRAGIKAMEQLADAQAEKSRLREALKFYADSEHYHFESDNWDSVSGEPSNILWHSEDPDFIEDGEVARTALSATAQPASPWIKCSDRLPDPEEHIRVFAVSALTDAVTIWATSSLLRNPAGFDMWMPLPAVPKKPTEGQNNE